MSLEEKVAALEAIVEKQSKLLAQTGQRMMELQVRNVKEQIKAHEPSDNDYVSNEDVVQLVGELQGQLDELESRSIKRLYNSQVTSEEGQITPISNKDGDLPPDFPKTLGEFRAISDRELVKLGIFYEILVPEESVKAAQEQIMKGESVGEFEVTDELVGSFAGEEGDELFEEVAMWVGVAGRRTKKNESSGAK